MIEVKGCSKAFGQVKAVNQATLDIGDREVFGLVGSNGAGKSTLLRMMAGIILPDQGEIMIDGLPVYENEDAKKLFFYISDDSYFPPNYTAADMVRFYRNFYPRYRVKLFHELMEQFHLEENRKISTYSKGMKKQLLVIIGVCTDTKYLFCDETFDGLDPVMRQAVKSLFASEIMNREFTPVIASHNLRELEDTCDHVGIMNQGKIMIERSLSDLQGNISKIQVACQSGVPKLPDRFEILHMSNTGRVYTLIVKGNPKEAEEILLKENPTIVDVLPLTLEEIFIYEMGGADYEVKDILF